MKCHANAYVKACAIISAFMLVAAEAESATYYVNAARPNDAGAGTNWVTAKKSIMTAVALAADGDTVIVTNGVYNSGTTVTPGSTLNNRVVVTNDITVRSVNGSDVTIIEGSGTNFYGTSSAVRCVYMSRGCLSGFTLRGGAGKAGTTEIDNGGGVCMYIKNGMSTATATNCIIMNCIAGSGGGTYAATLNNCTLTGNSGGYGGGSHYGTLNNCTLSGNKAWDTGGGSYYGTLNNCTLAGNEAKNGGGSYSGTLNNCTLTGNTASSYGGGSYQGTLNNCTLMGNTAGEGGGSCQSYLNNCTLTGNTAKWANRYSGGSSDGTLRNCIVWGNTNSVGAVINYEGGTFLYSCTYPEPSSGEGNISSDPMFLSAQDLHLQPGSPCIDGGNNSYATLPTDLDGNPRIQNGVVDMGAYEGGVDATPVIDPPSGTFFTNSLSISISCPLANAQIRYTLDGRNPTEGDALYTAPFILTNAATVAACAFKDGVQSAVSLAVYHPAVLFVDASRIDDSGVGTSWGTAKKTIQAAVNLAADGAAVLVTNGIYNIGTTVTPGYTLNNRVVITNDITVRSVNGPDVTIIEGSGTNFFDTSSAVRCVFMSNGRLDGFTLQNGTTYRFHDYPAYLYEDFGGGVNMYNSRTGTTITNCIIQHCMASTGGGTTYGTVYNCMISENTALGGSGGGSFEGTLHNCMLSGNTASSGGGSYWATLNNCTLSGNTAKGASGYGGGSFNGTLSNCTLTGNTAKEGGGSRGAWLYNCTLFGNVATNGCGSYNDFLHNCIVWGNTLTNGMTDNYTGGTFSYSCTTPLPAGVGNIALDPRFVGVNDLRLRGGSPCIDGGNNSYATLPTDLDGNPRIQNGVVDMGAYEGGVFSMVVTFDPRGGTVPVPASKTVTYSQAYGSLATTTRTGYYCFAGWYTNAACTGPAVTETTAVDIANDHSLFAKWVEQATSWGPVPVPYSWLIQYPVLMSMALGNFEIAALIDADLDGVITWQEYVAGTVPTDYVSVFRAGIDVIGGEPRVSWTPDLGSARVYTVEGKTNLTDAVWGQTNAGSRFYRVRVDMP